MEFSLFKRLTILFPYIAGLLVGLLAKAYLDFVAKMGHRIPQPDLEGDYTTAILWAVGLTIFTAILPFSKKVKTALLILWFAKVMIALFVMLFYEEHYGLDAYWYFKDAARGTIDWSMVGFENGTENIKAILYYLELFLPFNTSYHAYKIFFAWIGLIGTYVYYRACMNYIEREDVRLLYLLGFFPSILFWSSILGKDPVVYFGIGLYFYGVVTWMKSGNISNIIFVAAGLIIASFIRSWLGFILLAPFIIIGVSRVRNIIVRLALFAVCFMIGMKALQSMQKKFHFESLESTTSSVHSISRAWNRGGSGQEAPTFSSPTQMLKFAPVGMFTALFRPMPGEVMNPFGLLAGLENFLLLYFFVKSIRREGFAIFKERAVLWAVTLILVWSFFYSFISYQNLGAAVRFKLQVLPIIVIVAAYLLSKDKLYGHEPHTD